MLFLGRTLLYTGILFILIYLYHFKQIGSDDFVYNEF
ncbi:MAG: teichoic acid D-Ala incorporation-associated protein DltX [Clostridiales Family XIII bacterium]|nr:teichoic acid D-Ala incorporation-associated protein DltX [Clostridiales Family XIII bacterium]